MAGVNFLFHVFSLEIVESAGGQYLKSLPRNTPSDAAKTFVIASASDKASLAAARRKNLLVVDKEILLTGLLRHELDFKANLLK